MITAKRKEDELEEKSSKAKPGPRKRGQNPKPKSKVSALASSRLAKMWADQLKFMPDPVIETRTRGKKR